MGRSFPLQIRRSAKSESITASEVKDKVLKGAFYPSVSQAVMVVTGFIRNLYLGRTFGPEQYGVFGVINAFIMINETVLLRGIYDTMSKFVKQKMKNPLMQLSKSCLMQS